MNERALAVAARARLYRLLADRAELSRDDRGELIDKTTELSKLDAVTVERADELDRLCGYAVRLLRRKRSAPVLDLLGTLDGDRLLAIYYALPEERRGRIAHADGVWAYRLGRAPEGIAEAQQEWASFAEPDPPGPAATDAFAREARRYRAGLSHDLSPEEVELVEQASTDRRKLVRALEGVEPEDVPEVVAEVLR